MYPVKTSFDEAYMLASDDEYGQEAIDTLLKLRFQEKLKFQE